MHIFVTTSDGKRTLYETDRLSTTRDLKLKIGRAIGVPMTYARLLLDGRLLPNNSVLEDLGVKRLSNIQLIFRPIVFTTKQLNEREGDRRKSAAAAVAVAVASTIAMLKQRKPTDYSRVANMCQNVVTAIESDSEDLEEESTGDS